MKPTRAAIVGLLAVASLSFTARAATPVLQIDASKPAAKVSPTLYGLMTEEINYSYDGGLYAELIRNRVFKGSEQPPRGGRGRAAPAPVAGAPDRNLMHWSVASYNGGNAAISIDTTNPLNAALGNSLKFDASSLAAGQRAGVANDGYWGIPVKPNTTYRASFYARGADAFKGPLTVAIESNDGASVFASADVPAVTSDWKKYELTLTTGDVKESATNRFVISTNAPGTVWFNLVSLFPPTYNNRANGNRVDLMQKLIDMKPAFLRFPGGNYVEGQGHDYFDWKKTVGDISQRPTHLSPWTYRSSDGMGLLEFLEWTEDMHAQPVLAVYAGFSLSGSFTSTGDALKPFVQDALDEIEYATGDSTTKWGAQRAADGHPAPFPVNFVEIGNEDNLGGGMPTYEARFVPFYDAIKAKYPDINVIATARIQTRTPDLLDEHYYFSSAEDAEIAAHKYDARPRGKTLVFDGEWATRIPRNEMTSNLKAALADAAWMTGMERNSDLVRISCYAPLLVNVNPPANGIPGGMQWNCDLIGYDALTSYGCPSYYVQKLFANYIGDQILSATMDAVPTASATVPVPRPRGSTQPATTKVIQLEQFYDVVTRDSKTGTIFLKAVNISGTPQTVHITLNGAGPLADEAECVVISSADNADTNSIADPVKIVPVPSKISGVSSNFEHTFPAYSVTMIAMKSPPTR